MGWYSTVFVPAEHSREPLMAPVVLHECSTPCNAFLQFPCTSRPTGSVHILLHGCSGLVDNEMTGPTKLYCGAWSIKLLACLLACSLFLARPRNSSPHATGHTRHPLPYVDRSTVVYLHCRLLYQYYLPIGPAGTYRCRHCGFLFLCSLLCHVCYRITGIDNGMPRPLQTAHCYLLSSVWYNIVTKGPTPRVHEIIVL